MNTLNFGPVLQLSRDARQIGGSRPTRDPASESIRRGVSVDRAAYAILSYEHQHLVKMRAVAATRVRSVVFSHASAALLWGIPIVGPELRLVHLRNFARPTTQSQRGIRWHNDLIRDEEVTERFGLRVTSFEQTVLDLACSLPFAPAVAVLDHAIRARVQLSTEPGGDTEERAGVPRDWLIESLASQKGMRGVRQARASAEFADARSGSPGESLSRAAMHLMHFPAPVLQQPFVRPDGGFDIVDFDWPEYGCFGEFDGFGKNVREEYTGGLPTAEVVILEKQREDRIRTRRPHAARWEWTHALDPAALRARLIASGLHPLR